MLANHSSACLTDRLPHQLKAEKLHRGATVTKSLSAYNACMLSSSARPLAHLMRS